MTAGAIIALILIELVLRAYPGIKSYAPPPLNTKIAVAVVVIVAIVLAAIVGFYVTQGIG